ILLDLHLSAAEGRATQDLLHLVDDAGGEFDERVVGEDLDRADVLGGQAALVGQRADQIARTQPRGLTEPDEEPSGGPHVATRLRGGRAAGALARTGGCAPLSR